MLKELIIASSACMTPICAPAVPDRSWHFFSQSSQGVINLLHDMTKDECEFVLNRALNRPATKEEKEQAAKRELEYKAQQEQLKITKQNWALVHKCEIIEDRIIPGPEESSVNDKGQCVFGRDVTGYSLFYDRLMTTTGSYIQRAECFQ